MKFLVLSLSLFWGLHILAQTSDVGGDVLQNPEPIQNDETTNQNISESSASSADKNHSTSQNKKAKLNPKVIDFEAEVIEGERKTPTLFLQIGLEKPSMDTVIYQRKDFNDFHVLSKDRRPDYQVPKKK